MHCRTSAPAEPGARGLDETQLASRWDVSVRTLQKWRRMGLGPVYLKLGNRVSYRLKDIERYEHNALRRGTGERAYA